MIPQIRSQGQPPGGPPSTGAADGLDPAKVAPGAGDEAVDEAASANQGEHLAARLRDPNRLIAFSDGVFAVLITILVLELRPPAAPSANGLLSLWPTAISYGVSYLFIAIVWINHHHLLRFADDATQRLIWFNFAHLFPVSLIPFTTSWISSTRLAPVPVCAYATIFLFVNLTYIALCWEAIDRRGIYLPAPVRRAMHVRSVITLAIFTTAAVVSLVNPAVGLA